MKFPNLKKYFFAHVIVILFYVVVSFILWGLWLDAHYPCEEHSSFGEPGIYLSCSGDPYRLFAAIILFCMWVPTILTIIEALFRKFVVEKYFPNLTFPISIKPPKWICVIHSIFFYTGLIPMICFSAFFIIMSIIEIFLK